MEISEVEERIKLLEKLGGIIREESRAYGIIDTVWGFAILAGFLIFQAVEILSLPWFYGLIPLIVLLSLAFALTVYFKRKIGEQLGYKRAGWLGNKIKKTWLATALIGGTAYMLVFWSPPVADIILKDVSPGEISGLILLGWLIIDGIGCMVQGIISESRFYTAIGFMMIISAVVVANISFVYSWSAFALTFGLGYLVGGLRDYRMFKSSRKAGVRIE